VTRKSGEYVTQVAAIGPLGLEYLARKTIQETIILRRHLRDFHDAG